MKGAFLNVAHLLLRSQANGPGWRAVVWLQGCGQRCPGCCNAELQPNQPRHLVRPTALATRIAQARGHEGLTVSGGEPFDQAAACAVLLAAAQRLGLSTLVFTGSTIEQLEASQDPAVAVMLSRIDVLVDGPYRRDLACRDPLQASANQRVLRLSRRYGPDDLTRAQTPRQEHIVCADSPVVISTGFPESDLPQGLGSRDGFPQNPREGVS